MPEQLPEWP